MNHGIALCRYVILQESVMIFSVQQLMQTQIDAASPMQRLVWSLLISMTFHLLVFFLVNSPVQQQPTRDLHRLTVNLVQALPPRHIKKQTAPIRRTDDVAQSTVNTAVQHTNEAAYRLDMNQLLNQVRDYASQELTTSKPALPLQGDYYGTYTGDDSGIFFFHLDDAGHASGSGQSDTRGIAFLIAGDVMPDGSMRMVGTSNAGSKFKGQMQGQLDLRTGRVSGSWLVPGILKGYFSGRQELQLSMNDRL